MVKVTKHFSLLFVLGVVGVLAVNRINSNSWMAEAQSTSQVKAPEFHQTSPDLWLNSEPLTMESLRGKVVMLDFWTFDCWNCYRSFPWMNEMEASFDSDDFIIIGVHTPEFEHEKVRENIEEKIAEFKLKHPTVMDNDFRYWKAMNNRFWPSYYLIDKNGNVRKNFIGETHANTRKAKQIEETIQALIDEPA